jgi:nicotinamide phosphoribosyltransferase
MCAGGKESEENTYTRLLTKVYPKGVVSIVSDTWDFWKVVTETLPKIKDVVMTREGKMVIRPDSGDPVKILVGDSEAPKGSPEYKGLVECLWDIFGGTVTSRGFKTLDNHVGAIYGDSITQERQKAILHGLLLKGFASDNVVLGIGSFTYQYVTRDTFGFAVKSTYAEVNGESREIFKQPKTDPGKNSHKGLLMVYEDLKGNLKVKDQASPEEEQKGLLQTVFLNGKTVKYETLQTIRDRVNTQLAAGK